MATQKVYGSSAEIQSYLIENIAPNYFDFDQVNNYRSGIFGYVNEALSVITMDTHNAINIARREFYPVSDQNPKSFYKMAALQQIGLPTVTPGQLRAVLLLDRNEVIANSQYSKDGVYSCVIDNTMSILAGNIPFSLLYPIVIISNESNGIWTHTAHYDKSISNDIDKNKSNNYYIANRTINQNGKKYLLLDVILYQAQRETVSGMVDTDSDIETATLLFNFTGNLANFEVFYIEEPGESKPIQLKKLMEGQSMVETPFCYYRLLNSNQIEISFPKNVYFTPELNSEIRLEVYTSLGKDGEFPSFSGDLTCSTDSEEYPYNNNMTILGKSNGSCKLAANAPSLEEYKSIIKAAYATNNTITTSNDLQVLFDKNSINHNKIVFRKKRSDAFDRTYGAYILLKDTAGNVIPTNTLTINMLLSEFDTYNDTTSKAIIKPGTLFEYKPEDGSTSIYTGKKVEDLILTDDLSEFDNSVDRFIYANPFLIMCTLNPNMVGYYINSMSENRSVEYTYMNDGSVVQFIGSNLTVERNAINGEDFYKFSIKISPTSDLDTNTIVRKSTIEDHDYYIRASQNGFIRSIHYDSDEKAVIADVVYENGEIEYITISSCINHEPIEYSNTDEDEAETRIVNDNYYVHPGYTLNVNVYDSFVEGDIIATKKVTDMGRIRAAIDFEDVLFDNGLYIPMVIEDYAEDTNIFTLCGYISTDDIIDGDNSILINNGIYEMNGEENDEISIPYKNLRVGISIFYKNEESNISNKYSEYDYFRMHTLTNTYMENSEDGLSLIKHIDYVRSTLIFNEPNLPADDDENTDVDDEIDITIKEIPLAKANWLKNGGNFSYMIQSLLENYETLQQMYYDLENNFGFDLKFYNTYGKSKFFKAGIKKEWKPSSQVNCSFRFGAYLSSITSQAAFLEKFRAYVKEAVEAINSGGTGQQSIYILTLTSNIQKKFSELGFLEYYGFNDFGEDTQKIEPIPTSEMNEELLANYIPEFINIATHIENGETVPNIDVTFLNSVEDK